MIPVSAGPAPRRSLRGRGSTLLHHLRSDRRQTAPVAFGGVVGDVWRRLADFDREHPQGADGLVALATAVISTPWLLRSQATAGASTWVLQAALIIPLIWRRRHPQGVFLVVAMVALVQWLVSIPLLADVSLLVALYTLAAHRTRLVAATGAAVLEVGVIMATTQWLLAGSWLRSFVFLSGLVAAALLLGANLQARRIHLEAAIERAERLEVERDQQVRLGAAAERTRIAREMHDVIAHNLAVIVTMADGAAAKLHREPDRAEAAINNVSEVGRQALRETRRVLGVLRDDTGVDGFAPQPGVAQIGILVEKLRATGLDTDLQIEGEPFAIPTGAELAVYRIVQEATTNTLKHAGMATELRIRLRYAAPEVEILVSDNGQRGASPPDSGDGHGIVGMRERVSLYSGTMSAGPAPAGGWLVRARLPVGSAAR